MFITSQFCKSEVLAGSLAVLVSLLNVTQRWRLKVCTSAYWALIRRLWKEWFQINSGCWQNPVPWKNITKVPIIFLAVSLGVHFLLLDASFWSLQVSLFTWNLSYFHFDCISSAPSRRKFSVLVSSLGHLDNPINLVSVITFPSLSLTLLLRFHKDPVNTLCPPT